MRKERNGKKKERKKENKDRTHERRREKEIKKERSILPRVMTSMGAIFNLFLNEGDITIPPWLLLFTSPSQIEVVENNSIKKCAHLFRQSLWSRQIPNW